MLLWGSKDSYKVHSMAPDSDSLRLQDGRWLHLLERHNLDPLGLEASCA